MAENKKISANWGGKREGAGAKKTLPPGTRTRSIKMTDREYESVKNTLNVIRREKKMSKYFKNNIFFYEDLKGDLNLNMRGSENGKITIASSKKRDMSEKFEIIDTKFANGFKVCVSDKEQKGAPITSFIGKNLFIFSDDDLKEIYTEGIIRISVYRAGDNQLFIRVEELDAGNIWMCFKYTDWDVEENNGRFKNLNDYIDDFVRKKENVKSVKKISIDTIEIVWYDAEFKGYMRSKCQFCVTKDLIGSVTLDMDVVRKNDVDKA